jgi:outer membrane protein OmpA-like peptidoglycan-associated protein
VYFTPLLPNPKGGDTLVLYFAFDEDELTPRTRRQLEIVADVLRGDRGKQLTISGHTDALGSEDYNQALSARRAEAVKRFLVECGVAEEQVRTVAQGPRRPRRPNFTRDGEDNPEGRRVNRRSEIYLDF